MTASDDFKGSVLTRSVRLIIFLAVLVGMILGAVYTAPRLFVLFDEAYNLNVSQTLAQRGVYASHRAEGDRLFDPAVTTGPTLLAPLALAMRLGGANLQVVRTTLLLIFCAGLVVVLLSAWELLGSAWAALVFLIAYYGTRLVLLYGLSALGEVLATDLMLAGLALLHRAERPGASRRAWLLAASGVAMGLSVLAKDMIIMVGLIMPAVWLWQAWRHSERGRPSPALLVPAVVAAVTAAGWRAVQVAGARLTLSDDALQGWNSYAAQTVRRLWESVTFAPLSHSAQAWHHALEFFGPFLLALAAALAGLLVVRLVLGERTSPFDGSFTHSVIGASAFAWLAWFVLVSGPSAIHKHLLPGILLAELVTVLVLRWLWCTPRRAARLAAVVVALILAWGVAEGIGWSRFYLTSSEQRLAWQRSSAAWIAANTPADAALSGWGWFVPWHIAFLAQRTPAEAHVETEKLEGLSDWFVVSAEIPWSNYTDERLADFLRRQGKPALDQSFYPVYRVTWRP